MRLITNSNILNDRMSYCLENAGKNTQVYIASAFFSEAELALKMVDNNCTIMLIVRLDNGTSPEALEKIINNPNIDIRYFTGAYFHPKFYIFGNQTAYLGSANFTHKGLTTNNEANIEFDSEEPVFDDLKQLFFNYWKEAEVLTKEKILEFKQELSNYKFVDASRNIAKKIGEVTFNNVGREDERDKKDIYISSFRKAYQLYINRFNNLKSIYEKTGVRRYPEVPLRIEVDRFLWWIREGYAVGETYKDVPERNFQEIEKLVIPYIKEFEITKNDYLDSSAATRFNNVHNGFASKEKIEKMDFEEIFSVLDEVYAFDDTLRFYNGGRPTLKQCFKDRNPLEKIKKTVIYLVFGTDDYEERIFNCLYLQEYKLEGFGDHCVKELYGLVNPNDIPICNGRTLKSMEWLGYGKL